MDRAVWTKLSYGLFVATAREDGFDNGCIVNTVCQVTSSPNRIAITVNKQNKTCAMIAATGKVAVSVLDESAPFDLFRHFGFQSGAQTDKFSGFTDVARGESGLYHLTAHVNAWLEGTVFQQVDLGTHILFLADVTDGGVLSELPSMTYQFYHANVKPKPEQAPQTKGWRCKVCGYVYEGEELPADFVCPWCKHGSEDFEPIR